MGSSSSNGGVPPGFRFHPTDEELLHYYLKKKVSFHKFDMDVIREVDLNKMEPWDLQERCRIGSTPQNEWYFFSHKDRKYPTGSRTNRATNAGFWKATGRDKCIRNSYKKIGMRKTLVFYKGRAPHGLKTDWIMHEYRLEDSANINDGNNSNEDGWVVCRVFKKKNLFKIGNEAANHNSSSSAEQQLLNNNNNNNNNNNAARSFMHSSSRENHHQYLLQQQQNNPSSTVGFELDKPELGLQQHYPHYPLFHAQPLLQAHKPMVYDYSSYASSALPSSSDPPVIAKQLMATNPRDCESGSEGLRYQVSEPGMEVGSCEQDQMGAAAAAAAARDGGAGMHQHEWGVLDGLVNEDSANKAAGVRFEDANPQSVHQINHHLSLRGEMDFWGYAKQ